MSDTVRADLRSYYEEEARRQLRGPLKGKRVETRDEFLQVLRSEGRTSVVDFGAGPGRDAPAFIEAGINYVGIDLAHGNAALAAESGITVLHGSIDAPPLRDRFFDGGWSMSTLMHVPEPDVTRVLTEMMRPLRAGAPFWIGQWGGTLGEHIDDHRLPGERRLFSLRDFDRNRELVDTAADIERGDVWSVGPEDWEYHLFRLRVRHGDPT